MLEYEVHSKKELIAAVSAAAQRTYADAKNNPVQIRCGSAKYDFKEGITERRAHDLINKIRATTAKAFEVA